jgi:glutathione S-transferase
VAKVKRCTQKNVSLIRMKPMEIRLMKIHVFPPSGRVVGIVALKNYLALDCELKPIDLGRDDQRAPEYVSLNPNRKIPTLEDDGVVLWESNAILFYMASKRPESGVCPSDLEGQADVLRWFFWETAHWDAESCGMVGAPDCAMSTIHPLINSARESS